MASKEMTPWFLATKQKPGRVGVYETRYSINSYIHYAYWTGRHWMATSRTIESARQSSFKSGIMTETSATWRGFTNEQ